MKKGIILDGIMFAWVYSLMAMVVVGIGYTIFSLLTGNYCGTASFEF